MVQALHVISNFTIAATSSTTASLSPRQQSPNCPTATMAAAAQAVKKQIKLKPLPEYLKLTRSRDIQNVIGNLNRPVDPTRYQSQFPARLLRFFTKYPPPASALAARFGTPSMSAEQIADSAATTPGPSPIASIGDAEAQAQPSASEAVSDAVTEAISEATATATSANPNPKPPPPLSTIEELGYHNPFAPLKIFTTGRWHGPRYGLRQQADLVKLAVKFDVVDLLPYTVKKPEVKLERKLESGFRGRQKGTGVGEKVKGKAWERTMKGRLEKRRKAMEGMESLIQEWKQKGHGRGWKKWPSGRAGKN